MAVPLIVSHAAMELIQTWIRSSAYSDPIVSLTCESQQHDNPDLTDAILGGATEGEIKKLALRFVKKRSVPYEMRLYPTLQERSEVPRDYIVRLSDIDFAFPPAMFHQMAG